MFLNSSRCCAHRCAHFSVVGFCIVEISGSQFYFFAQRHRVISVDAVSLFCFVSVCASLFRVVFMIDWTGFV